MSKVNKKWLPIISLILIGFVLYIPSLFGKFLWDDEDFVYANTYVTDFRLDKLFSDSITSGRGKLSNYYRPIQGSLYALTHSVFGFNTAVFHFQNLGFHIFAAIAIFLFFKGLSKNITISFLIALIFLVHPVQTEAVSYVSGLSDPLYVFFGFLSLIYFQIFQQTAKRSTSATSLILFLLTLLSKETGLVFLGIISLLWFLESKRNSFSILTPYLVVTFSYLAFHFGYINNLDTKEAWGSSPYTNSILIRLATFIQNLFLYISIAIFPIDLYMERDYSIQIPSSILTPHTFAFLIIFLTISCYLWFNHRHKNRNLLIFSFLAFFGSFVPVSGLIFINGIFYEHFLYLPLVFLASFLLFLFSEKLTRRVIIFILIYFTLLFGRNVLRQLDWIDPIRFYKKTLIHAPGSIRIGNNLGIAYAESGDFENAISQYKKTLSLNSQVPNLYHNLANTYQSKGDMASAVKYYQEAIAVDPEFYYSYIALANLYRQMKENQKELDIINQIRVKFPEL